jgi:Mg-chelatase subunit ChlD/uncharacterized protein involved in exopolysaccharide biosynthesis
MKPQKSRTPRQELEASLTALLLGELPADKATALRELMAKDAELARLYERLEQTVGLVRETAAPSEQTVQSAPLKLSTKRREQLLAHFKTVAPKEFTNPKRLQIQARELAIAAGIVGFIGLGAWFVFDQESFSSTSRIKAEIRSPVSSVTEQTTARLAAEQGLNMAQQHMVATYSSSVGESSRGIGTQSQTIFDEQKPGQQRGGTVLVSSAGKSTGNQIVLPTATDFEVNGKDSPVTLSVSTNFIASNSQWVGILERGNYSPGLYSTNQFVSRSASIVIQTNTAEFAEIANLAHEPRAPVLGQFDTNGFSGDELLRRQAGGLAWADNMHSKQGNVGLAEGEVQEMSRAKLQEAVRTGSAPVEKVPLIDPATGLPVTGAYATGAIDPATGLPVPVEVAEAQQKMPEPATLATRTQGTRAFQVDTDAFFTAREPFKDAASQMPSTAGGTGGGGGGGGAGERGRTIVSEQVPAPTLRLPAKVAAQTATPSTPIAGEKLAEIAKEGKDASGSNIYLGTELARADVKFGTWGLETGQAAAQSGGTKNEEERLKQVDEVRDGATIAGRAATPGLGFNLSGPKKTPVPSSIPVGSERVPALGDLPTLGKAFKTETAEPGLQLIITNATAPGAKIRHDVVAVGGNVTVDDAPSLNWSFQTDTSNRGAGESNVTPFATDPSNLLDASFFYVRGPRSQTNWVRNFTVDADYVGAITQTAGQTTPTAEPSGQVQQTPPYFNPSNVVGYYNVKDPGSNYALSDTNSYDRYTHYRLLEQLGTESNIETKLALNYSKVTDEDRKKTSKSSAGETKGIDASAPSELVSEVIPFKYAKASEIASALNSLSSAGGGGAAVGGGTGTRSTGGFGRTGTGANYGSPSTPQANVKPAAGDSFTNRLRGIINRAANAGEIVAFGQTKMIADERSNSLLLYASRDEMKIIKEVIAKLDVEPGQVTDPKVAAKPTTSPQLHASYKITDALPNSEAPTMLMSAETLRKLEGMRIELEAQVMQQETQLAKLKEMPRDKLVWALPTATSDTHLNSLLEQKNYAEQALIIKHRELGEASPEVTKLRSQVSDLNSKIDQQTEGILSGLDGRVTAVREQLNRLRDEVKKAQTNDIAEGKKAAPYWEAKRKLDELQQVSQVLAMKIASENIEASLPKTTMVEILDDAVPAQAKKTDVWDRIRGKGKVESIARLKLWRDESSDGVAYDPFFVQNEFESIKSDRVLGKVVEDLNLRKEWGKGGQTLSTNQAIALLIQKLDLQPVRNTSFVDIGAKGDKPEEAAKLANAVAKSYQEYRFELRRELSSMEFTALERRSKEQDVKVANAQREVERLRAELGIDDAKAAANQPVTNQQIDAAPSKPAVPLPVPQPEIHTRENAFSTFSLNVSDVAFKLAAASLEKGQMPEPASIRSEEFINAFDYRDPEAPAGVPVAFAWERARYPYAQNRDLLRFSIKTAAHGRQAGRPLNLVLLMDNSGSMERADRVAIIREALKVLASQLQPQDKLSVITFARTAQLRVDGVAGNQAAQVAEDIGGLTPEGGTNIEEAMNLAYQTALRHYLANGINRVVLLTDGAANLGNVEPELLMQKVEANRKQGVALDCFGIGWEGFNDDLLETLSRNGDGRYGFINSPEEAATEFAGQLAGALNVAASDVKVQVEFNPARVTAYRQIGYAKHQLTKEQFRDNTVDAAEIAAQEAGNALYVTEVNPAGQGPLGTVRVRFKVPGTSDYREHEWTVPFSGNAVAMEQGSPAMRLAATASAFSEWLASSPYATEVTPDTLLRYLSGVPEVYGADGRPKKLEWMIRQAKSVAGGEIRNSTTDEHR